jgi:hypothetical protein
MQRQQHHLLIGVAAAVGAVRHQSRHDQPLDLLSALVDLEDLGVTHQFFNGVFAVVAVAAENLQSVRGLVF